MGFQSEPTNNTSYYRDRDSQGFPQIKRDATDAGQTAGEARRLVEKRLGRPVVSSENFLNIKPVKQVKGKSNKQQEPNGPTLFDVQDQQ